MEDLFVIEMYHTLKKKKKQFETTHIKGSIITTLVTKLNACRFSCLHKMYMKENGEKVIFFTASINLNKRYKKFYY